MSSDGDLCNERREGVLGPKAKGWIEQEPIASSREKVPTQSKRSVERFEGREKALCLL
jgi:hypothetical protein